MRASDVSDRLNPAPRRSGRDPDGDTAPAPPRLERSSAWLRALAFAAVYVIWGSTYLGIRVAVRTLPPFSMAACRFLLAGGALYGLLRGRGVRAPRTDEWRRAALAGALMLMIGNGLVTWAEQRVASNQAALMIAAVPLFTALLDWWRPGGARPRPGVLLGIALGAAGMVLLVSGRARGIAGAPAPDRGLPGVAALLLSGLGWAAGSLYSRYGSMHPHPVMAAAQQMIAGGVGLGLLALLGGEPSRVTVAALTLPSVGAFVYLTLFGSLLAFSAYGWLIKVSTPARLSTTAYVNPVVAVVLGWLVLGETLAARALMGAALIVCAVLVMTVRPPRSWRRPEPLATAVGSDRR